jgi:hypothetical protein
MDALLDGGAVSYGTAARFILEAAGVLPEGAGPAAERAFAAARDKGWLPKKAAPGTPAKLEGIALLVMGAFRIKGGIGYTLFHSPHYAYRDMVYRKIIQGRSDPSLNLSGERLLRIIARVLDYTGNDGYAGFDAGTGADFD